MNECSPGQFQNHADIDNKGDQFRNTMWRLQNMERWHSNPDDDYYGLDVSACCNSTVLVEHQHAQTITETVFWV